MIRGFISPTYAATTSRAVDGPSIRGGADARGSTTVKRTSELEGGSRSGRAGSPTKSSGDGGCRPPRGGVGTVCGCSPGVSSLRTESLRSLDQVCRAAEVALSHEEVAVLCRFRTSSSEGILPVSELDWTDLDKRAVATARVLPMDAMQNIGNGHLGTAMSLAPIADTLFQKAMRHNPADPDWAGRDRFVLSAGHSSITLYTQLFLAGFGLEIDDLKSLRTWGSKTPGHPEHGHTAGVETTTGPLGQGVGNAVGMAMAARRERGLFDPETPAGQSPFDHNIWSFASDGDMEEGLSNEAASIAAVQRLGNLTLLWDDNHISIEDDTNIALSED